MRADQKRSDPLMPKDRTRSPARAPARKPEHSIAATLRRFRQDRGWTLNELARRCTLAPSTLSKIENGQMSPTYDTILSLAEGLEVDVAELFSVRQTLAVGGRRTVTPSGAGVVHKTLQYDYEMLCTDLANKQFVPILARINANSIEAFEMLIAHPGEEFVYVLSGSIELHTEFYAPTALEAGDSCYFDSSMGHALIRTSDQPAEILWVCSRVVAPLRS